MNQHMNRRVNLCRNEIWPFPGQMMTIGSGLHWSKPDKPTELEDNHD